MRILLIVLLAGVVVAGAAWSLGCCSAPDATTLPEDESEVRVIGAPAPPAAPTEPSGPSAPGPATPDQPATPEPVAAAPAPIPTTVTYEALAVRSVKGGRIRFVVPGTVADVLSMLLDFGNAAGHRSWAQSYRTISTTEAGVLAEWKFRGKMGIAPTVHLLFRVERKDKGAVVRYELKKKSFGIASFFGDYQITTLPGTPARVELAERVFIDSGIPFANASASDIEKGLREDARLIRAWMTERTGQDR